jgi:hypothetical protein
MCAASPRHMPALPFVDASATERERESEREELRGRPSRPGHTPLWALSVTRAKWGWEVDNMKLGGGDLGPLGLLYTKHHHTAMKKLRIVILGFGTSRQNTVLE